MPATLKLSHLDKVLFPDADITKGDLIEHYRSVAGRMLPQVHDRPMALVHYPDGLGGPSFFQQAAPRHTPSWIRHAAVPKEGGEIRRLRRFARDVCAVLEFREPGRFTTEMRRNKRGGRLFLDTTRNAYARLAVAPYSVRATPDARVATPLDWSELDDTTLTADRFTVRTMARRLAEPDPWRTAPEPASSLTTARRRLADLPA